MTRFPYCRQNDKCIGDFCFLLFLHIHNSCIQWILKLVIYELIQMIYYELNNLKNKIDGCFRFSGVFVQQEKECCWTFTLGVFHETHALPIAIAVLKCFESDKSSREQVAGDPFQLDSSTISYQNQFSWTSEQILNLGATFSLVLQYKFCCSFYFHVSNVFGVHIIALQIVFSFEACGSKSLGASLHFHNFYGMAMYTSYIYVGWCLWILVCFFLFKYYAHYY